MKRFTERWDDQAWLPKGKGPFTEYLRPLDDPGWPARMRALRALSAEGEASVAPTLAALREDAAPTRALAAQVLGFLGSNDARTGRPSRC